MAKKTVAKAVKLNSIEDLRAWILSFAWPGWSLVCMTYMDDQVSESSRTNHSNYSARLRIRSLELEIDLQGGSVTDVARKFQTVAWPQIQRAVQEQQEQERRRRIAPPPLKRLTNNPDPVLFR